MHSDLRTAVDPTAKSAPDIDDEYYLAKTQWEQFRRAYDAGHDKYLTDSAKFDGFYSGDGQWDPADKAALEGEGRPALTINMVLPTINVVLGEQSARRVDIQYKPRRDGSEESAAALTKLAMSIADANKLNWVESTVFADGLIQDRGYYDVRIDWSRNMEGDIRIKDLDPGDVIPDPDAKSYDPADWKEVFITRWVSLDDIDEQYGKAVAAKLRTVAELGQDFGRDSIKKVNNRFGDTDNSVAPSTGDEETRKFVKSVRVVERQFFKNVRVHCLVNPENGDLRELPVDTKLSEARQLAARFQTYLYSKTLQKVRWRVTADRYVLHDDWSPYRSFTVIPYFPYFRRGKPFGMVRNLVSPQEQFNKLSSQELHIVNSTANSGYIVEKGALHGMTTDDLRAHGSKTGVVIEVNPGRMGSVEKIKPNQIPTGIDRIATQSQNNIKQISGITDALLGMESAEVSGVALESKEKRGQVQIQVPLDNLARTRHLLARKLLELVQDFYTSERIIQITNDLEPGQPRDQLVINQPQADGSIRNDVTTGEYDIVISTMPTRDSFNDMQFAEALNMRNVGIQIPDYRVIQYSHLTHKDAIADEVRQLTGLGELTPEQQELQMRGALAELEDAEAEVQKKRAQVEQLRTQAQLNSAKAEDIGKQDERQLRDLDQKHSAQREGNTLRRDLATLSAINKLDQTELAGRIANQNKAQQHASSNR